MKKMLIYAGLAVITAVLLFIVYNQDNNADFTGENNQRIIQDSSQPADEHNQNKLYVAADGSDQNDGTKSNPLHTLKKASSMATAGTTVYIREGTYKEKLVVKHSGTKSKPIIFAAYPNEKAVLDGESIQSDEDGDTSLVIINDKSNITISGLTIQNVSTKSPDETVMGMYVTGSSSHIRLENNHVQGIETHANDGNGHGIAVYGSGEMKDITIVNNTVEDLLLGASESLVLNGNIDGFNVENNIVRRSNNIGIDLIGYEGVAEIARDDYVRNGIVRNNQVYDISSFGNPAYGEDYSAGGIYMDGGKNITVEKNTIYRCDIGIEATSEHPNQYADHITISKNTVYDNYYTGISIGGYDKERGGTRNTAITQNILYRNDTKGLDGGQLLIQYDTKDNLISKNIMTAGPSRIFIANDFTENQDNRLEENVYHKEKGKAGIWIWKKQEYTSFSAFKADTDSAYIDPKFVNESKHNFKLKKNSPARSVLE